MILSTDNYQRIYDQLQEERVATQYYLGKNLKRVHKMFRKSDSAPACHWDVITLPKTNNTYLLFYYALYTHEILSDACWYGAALMVNDENGHRVVILPRKMRVDEDPYETIQVYSGHFFSRYRERMWLSSKLSVNDIIATYFGRNEGYMAELDYDKFVLEENQYKSNRVFGVDDGVTFADAEILPSGVLVFKHKTFLSRNELKKDQLSLLPFRDVMRMQCVKGLLTEKK